jgi:predicted acylesterase/phospholipase RssA
MAERPRLGLALSGGGFRASFFHLGVLRRLAELDLLRHVSVLSTVSGGSVIGAAYMLHLAKRLKKSAKLSRDDYVALTGDVEKEFRAGTSRDLRTRLLVDPLQNLRMFCTTFGMGRRMARLYHTHLYRNAASQVRAEWSKDISFERFRIEPGGKALDAEIETYNAADDRVPKWVVNATCLNTGRPFRLSPSELGDPVLGSLRFDEVDTVLRYKALLLGTWTRRGTTRTLNTLRDRELDKEKKSDFRERTSWHLAWWLAAQAGLKAERAKPADPKAGETAYREKLATLKNEVAREATWLQAALEGDWDVTRRLVTAEFDVLRRAKLAAWYLRDGARKDPPVTGGATAIQHTERLWTAITDIDVPLAERLRKSAPAQDQGLPDLAEFALDLFFLRSAVAFAWTAKRAIQRLTLAQAVAASANFPPVFPPFEFLGLYDPGTVWRLSLTDGGVHDNTGLAALLDEGCTHIIASDAGRLLRTEARPAGGRLAMSQRITDALMANVRDQQLAELRERRRVTEAAAEATFCKGPRMTDIRSRYRVESVVFIHMTSSPNDGAADGLPPHPFAEEIARLRTDLDAFHAEEIDALIYQGYQLSDRFVRRWLGKAFTPDTSPVKNRPIKLPTSEPALRTARRILRAGAWRFFRFIPARPLPAVLVLLVLLGALAALAWFVGFPVSGAAASLGRRIADFARWPLLFGGYELLLRNRWSGWVLVGGLATFTLLWTLWPRLEVGLARALSGFMPRGVQVGAIRVARFVGLWRRNVWWLLGYAPAVLALLGSLVAAVSYGVNKATKTS